MRCNYEVNYPMGQGSISRFELMKIKGRALRHRVWFKTLDRIERAIINLTIKCVEKVRSLKLAEIVMAILNKLKQNLENRIKTLIKQVGVPLAQRVSQIAQKWGNKFAYKWAEEPNFIQYLIIIHINTPTIFRSGILNM